MKIMLFMYNQRLILLNFKSFLKTVYLKEVESTSHMEIHQKYFFDYLQENNKFQIMIT